jgi:SAM-dependent methyltransferase
MAAAFLGAPTDLCGGLLLTETRVMCRSRALASGKMRYVNHPDHIVMARAVYEATAPAYQRLVGSTISAATETAADRQLLEDLLRLVGTGPVADLGSGPGRVAAMCHEHDLDSIAVDMAFAMLRIGRETHRHIPFVAGYLPALPFVAGSFSAAVLWYSITHTPPADLEALFAQVRRVVAPGSSVLVAFQAGDGGVHERTDAYDAGMTMISWRHEPAVVAAALTASGFVSVGAKVRAPELPHETGPQAFVSATAAR